VAVRVGAVLAKRKGVVIYRLEVADREGRKEVEGRKEGVSGEKAARGHGRFWAKANPS
jgi:hypothetical protein